MQGAKGINRFRDAMDGDDSSTASFPMSLKPPRPHTKRAWTGGTKVDEENFLSMQQQYLQMRTQEKTNEQRIKQLTAQLARTEEAAKRALIQSDGSARGGVAQRLLDAERLNQRITATNHDLEHRLEKERKRANDLKVVAEKSKKKVDSLLREQRQLVRRIGDMEGKKNRLRRSEIDYLSEEAGQRFVKQQEELLSLREENEALRSKANKGGRGNWEKKAQALEGQVKSLEYELSRAKPNQDESSKQTSALSVSPSDWILEDVTCGNEAYLMDPTTQQLFNYTGRGEYPKPLGYLDPHGGFVLTDSTWMDRVVCSLDGVLKAQQRKLRDAFKHYGEESAQLIGHEPGEAFLQNLFEGEEDKWLVDFFLVLLIEQDDDPLTFEELRALIEACRTAARAGQEKNWHSFRQVLKTVQSFLEDSEDKVRDLYEEKSRTPEGPLDRNKVFSIIKHALPEMTPQEQVYLLMLLNIWDTNGKGLTFPQVLRALEIGNVKRSHIPQLADPERDGRRNGKEYSMLSENNIASVNRVDTIALESEIMESRKREDALRMQNSTLRRDISDLEAKYREIEEIAMLNDPDVDGPSIDSQIKAAWKSCNAFKKRYLECRSALEAIKMNHEKTLQQLSDTHAGLEEKTKRCYKLENEVSKLNVKVLHVQDLEVMLQNEREDRVKAEKDALEAQQKAFAAPGGALQEVTNLRREILELQRCKSQAERKEAEVRRELLVLRQAVSEVSVNDFRRMEREFKEAKQHNAQLRVELEASVDKLHVYRQTQASRMLPVASDITGVAAMRYPDDDKKEEELRIELCQLREVYAQDREQSNKMRALLDRECEISLEARAALESAEAQLDLTKRELGEEMAKLKREVDRKQEKIHKLEEQLKGTVTGLGKALVRSSQANKNALEAALVGAELKDNENIFELQILEAKLEASYFGEDSSVFVSVDFFEHDTQATGVFTGLSPCFDTKIRFVVESDDFFIKYLDTSVLVLELNQAKGWDYDPVATGRMALRRVMEEAEVGSGTGERVSFHHVDLVGATGATIGTLRFGFRVLKPILMAIAEYKKQSRAAKTPLACEVDTSPERLSNIRVLIHRCEDLKLAGSPEESCPYVSYKFPGKEQTYDTQCSSGINPVFQDEATFEFVRTQQWESDLKKKSMELAVYDEAAANKEHNGMIGICFIPLDALLDGIGILENSYTIKCAASQQPTGVVFLSVDWHQPLQMPTIHKAIAPVLMEKLLPCKGEKMVQRSHPLSCSMSACQSESEKGDLDQREMADADTDEKEHAFLAPNVRSDEKMIEALGPAGENFLQPSENQIHTEAEEVYPDTTQGQHHHQEIAYIVGPDRMHWPDPRKFLVVHIVSVTLDPIALACPEVQSLIVVQSFLDEICSVDIQGSNPIPKARGHVEVNHAVGYNIQACQALIKPMIKDGDCRMYLGIVSQISKEPATGTVSSRVSTEAKGDLKYLDIGMVEIDLLRLRDSGTDLDTATFQIPSSDKYHALTGSQRLGDMKLTILGSESLRL